MFYIKELDKELEVHPRFFGPRLREEIERRLRQEVRCLPTAQASRAGFMAENSPRHRGSGEACVRACSHSADGLLSC